MGWVGWVVASWRLAELAGTIEARPRVDCVTACSHSAARVRPGRDISVSVAGSSACGLGNYSLPIGLNIQIRSGACFLIFRTSSGTAFQSPLQRASSSESIYWAAFVCWRYRQDGQLASCTLHCDRFSLRSFLDLLGAAPDQTFQTRLTVP